MLDVLCETRTLDCVFVNVHVAIPFRVIVEKSFDAYYRLTNPTILLQSYVYDVLRTEIPRLTLDELFATKSKLAMEITNQLKEAMQVYGYDVLSVLITQLSPDSKVVQSMNEINASKRLAIVSIILVGYQYVYMTFFFTLFFSHHTIMLTKAMGHVAESGKG